MTVQRVWRHTIAALLAAVVCLVVVTVPTTVVAAGAAPATPAAAANKYAPPPIPAFEKFFAQQFRVSVMTQSYGVFNATLRMRGSMNFPERVHGELIPLGEPRLQRQSQTRLPHFDRTRGVEDEKLSDLPFAVSSKPSTGKPASREFTGGAASAAASEEERPSLLVVDLQLMHSDATQGKAQVYYLPAELMALRSQREAMSEGSTTPSATADFSFRLESPQMSGNPISDTPALARVSAAAVTAGPQRTGEASSAGSRGDVVFRWISEHEFSASFSIPMAAAGDAAPEETRLERIWVHGYVAPSTAMFDRKERQLPWYNRYLMLGVGLMGFVVQVISGWTEGKTKAVMQAEGEDREKAKLEAALKDQERLTNKKKK